MPKVRRVFVCRQCGASQHRWLGKCPDCNAWDALEEQILDPAARKDPHRSALTGMIAGGSSSGTLSAGKASNSSSSSETQPNDPAARSHALAWAVGEIQEGAANLGAGDALSGPSDSSPQARARSMAQIELDRGESTRVPRLASGIRELDRVLGISGDETDPEGISVGLVPGSAVLVAGEPGIGKSTLLLQAAAGWAALEGVRVLYASSEESAEQVSHRAARVLAHHDEDDPGAQAGAALTRENLFLMHDANLARILEQVRRVAPTVLVIDSVQMIYKGDVSAAPGSVTQLRRCCADLVYLAKAANIAVVLVGHVTKDGVIAGPRLLEHLVDTVVTFEGERAHTHRIVRSVKNRFGTTLEIGLFEMTGFGLREVPEGASVAALADKDTPRPGSVVCPVLTGTRCVLVEVQALTATGFLGAAKRKCSGLDANRLAMIIAVLEQHAGLRLADRDIFASSVGGLRIIEPAGDLALLLAIAGAHYRKALPARTIVAGEVGLGGEIRPVPHLEQRVREAARLGFVNMLVPASTESARLSKQARTLGWGESVALIPLKNVNDAIQQLGL